MRRLVFPVVALALAIAVAAPAAAQSTKKAQGSVSAMAADSITVKVGATEMKFMVDDKTTVEAPGAGTKSRAAAAAGKPGPKLSESVQVGNAVVVSYHDMGGSLHAATIKKVSSAGSGGVPPKRASGTVASVSGSSITINGSSGGATFSQTYVIDASTRVIGKGAATKTAAAGGRANPSDLIASGDKVSLSFKEEGGSLHATNITVTAKASK